MTTVVRNQEQPAVIDWGRCEKECTPAQPVSSTDAERQARLLCKTCGLEAAIGIVRGLAEGCVDGTHWPQVLTALERLRSPRH